MEVETAIVIPLHTNWKYLDMCCDLINEEWPRSTTARMHGLAASCNNFPTSLILLITDTECEKELVIGHSKVSVIHGVPAACLIETVVIAPKFRRKGWGRHIMQETEKYVKMKGKSLIYLSTKDKEEFYKKLGYTKCEPASIYEDKRFGLEPKFSSSYLLPKSSSVIKKNENINSFAPSPPPLPKFNLCNSSIKIYMRKSLV